MPRLTRTQKFADLREQLANSKEELITSQELKTYEDKLANVEETLAPQTKTDVVIEDVWNDYKEEDSSFNALDSTPWDIKDVETVQEPVVEQPVETVEEITVKQAPVEEKPAETINSYFDSFINNGNDTQDKSSDDFASYFEKNNEKLNSIVDDNFPGVFKDVNDDSGEIVSQKERDTYLNQTIPDVSSYNVNNGQLTIDQLVDNSVDEVRHKQENTEIVEEVINEETPKKDSNEIWTEFVDEHKEETLDADTFEENPEIEVGTMNDDEFSNTVSLEITKIIDQLANTPEVVEETPVVEEVAEPVEEKVEEVVEETPVIDQTIVTAPIVEEKQEEVVEIKNISEMDNTLNSSNTMSNTIPFIVAENSEEIEDDEEDGSNTVLNVILIVLIVVLVAVLGLIVFYILKTKGIF